MSKKLLHKTLRAYIVFSIIVLLVSAPVFYFFTEKLFIEDADEALLLRKEEFLKYNQHTLATDDIPKWNEFNRDIKLEQPGRLLNKDSIFYQFFLDTLANENEPYRVLLAPVRIGGQPFFLMVRINLVESEDIVLQIGILFCVVLILLLSGLYFITRRLSTKIWKPFYFTLNQIEQFNLDTSAKPVFPATDVQEFTRLNESASRLFEKNVTVYKSQKEFIENAAHELQTPLAAFQAKLDTLAQQLPFTDELSSTLTDLNDSASRLNRINRNLLLLSRMENNQYKASERVEVAKIIEKQVTFLTEQAEERSVSVQIKHVEPLTLHANSTLLDICIGNLLLNSLRYNYVDGVISVSLHSDRLIISNTGKNAPLDYSGLFERFSNTHSGGNGLGLAIVRKICQLHGWSILYFYENNMHNFQITF